MNADKRHGLARGKGDKQNRDKYKRKIPTRKPSPQYVKQVVLKFTLGTKIPLTHLKGLLFLGPVYMEGPQIGVWRGQPPLM